MDDPQQQYYASWIDSKERAAARNRYFLAVALSILLVYCGIMLVVDPMDLGLSGGYSTLVASVLFLLAVFVALGGVARLRIARARFLSDQQITAKEQMDTALRGVDGPADLLGMLNANRKQMDAYDAIARLQAETSYRTSQVAMYLGLLLIAGGIVVAILAESPDSKYAAAIITVVGASIGGYLARTFLAVQQTASNQMSFFFKQPLILSYLLHAERLMLQCTEDRRQYLLERVIDSALQQIISTANPLGQDMRAHNDGDLMSAKADP